MYEIGTPVQWMNLWHDTTERGVVTSLKVGGRPGCFVSEIGTPYVQSYKDWTELEPVKLNGIERAVHRICPLYDWPK